MVAVPLLALRIPIDIAAPVAVLVSIILLGRMLNRRLQHGGFLRCACAGLVAVSFVLLAQSLAAR